MEWSKALCLILVILELPATFQYLEGCDGNVDVVFLVDTSESMIDLSPYGQPLYAWQQHQTFLKKVVQHLPIGQSSHMAQVAMVTFSSTPSNVFHLNQHATSIHIQNGISAASFRGGNTNSAAALRAVRESSLTPSSGARNTARQVIVMFSDGLSNLDEHLTISEAIRIKQIAEVFTITLSKEHNLQVLQTIASVPFHEHIMIADDISDLDDWMALTLAHRICDMDDPMVTTKTPTCLPGDYCDVCMENCAVCHTSDSCDVCNIGWYWEPLTNLCQECEVTADLAFVIDSSGSIRDKNPKDQSYDNYQLLKDFVNQIIDRLDVSPDTTRVGAVRFSSASSLVFTLDEYANKADMKEAINNMKFDGHETNIAQALRTMREQVFVPDKGDRPEVRNIAIIITDGESNIDEHDTLPQAELAKKEEAVLFVVGVTDMINKDELTAIASDPDSDHFFNSTEIRYLDSIMQNLIKHVCTPENSDANTNR